MDFNKQELIKKLESILTIDGKGRPKKAKELSELFNKYQHVDIFDCLKEISDRKHF